MTAIARLRAAAEAVVDASEGWTGPNGGTTEAFWHLTGVALGNAPALAAAVLALMDGHWLGDCGDPTCPEWQALAAAAAMLPEGEGR